MTRSDRHRWQEPDRLAPVILIAAGLVAAVLFWPYVKKSQEPAREKSPAVLQDGLNQQRETDEMQIQYPVPQQVEQPGDTIALSKQENIPLPVPDKSNDSVEQELRHLYNEQKLGNLFLPENLIVNFVVTIDNMTGIRLPQKYRITKPPVGQFQTVIDAHGTESIDHRNYARYTPYIDLLDTVDISRVVSFYVSHYDLFQQAYRDLGYPGRYFNDRFVQVLDHLLTAPEVQAPIQVIRPKVTYQFADAELEALSAGQKILVRMGPDNAVRVKSRIRELRQILTSLQEKK